MSRFCFAKIILLWQLLFPTPHVLQPSLEPWRTLPWWSRWYRHRQPEEFSCFQLIPYFPRRKPLLCFFPFPLLRASFAAEFLLFSADSFSKAGFADFPKVPWQFLRLGL